MWGCDAREQGPRSPILTPVTLSAAPNNGVLPAWPVACSSFSPSARARRVRAGRRPKAISIRSTPSSRAMRPMRATRRCGRRCRTRSWSIPRWPASPTPTDPPAAATLFGRDPADSGRGRQDRRHRAAAAPRHRAAANRPPRRRRLPAVQGRRRFVTLGALAGRQATAATAAARASSIFDQLGAAPARRPSALSRCARR